MHLGVSYAEIDKTTRIELRCNGESFDPLSQDDAGLGVTIVKNIGKTVRYSYENGINNILVVF